MIRLLTFRAAIFLAIVTAVCSCQSDEATTPSNVYDLEAGVGFKELKFTLPYLERLAEAVGYEDVVLRFMGAEDHQGYDLDARLIYEGGEIILEILSEEISQMAHQIYYLNTLKYSPEVKSARADDDESSTMQSVSLGVKISLEDANDLQILSTIDTALNRVYCTSESGAVEYLVTDYSSLYYISDDWINATSFKKDSIIYKQTDNIDLTDVELIASDTDGNIVFDTNIYPGNWVPIGTNNLGAKDGLAFNQIYDGGGFTISKMQNQENNIATAFFYKLGDGAVVRNVSFEDTFYNSTTSSASVAVYADKGAEVTIENVFASGVIAGGSSAVGGFIGENEGADITFENCSSMMSLSPSEMKVASAYGGFIGLSSRGELTFNDCSFMGSITNVESNVGGYIGQAESSTITISGCSTTAGNINSREYVGGVVGYLSETTLTLDSNSSPSPSGDGRLPERGRRRSGGHHSSSKIQLREPCHAHDNHLRR
ncbi:MAG: hypothetical protein SNH41_04010 [Rikenellaceae bacterium]